MPLSAVQGFSEICLTVSAPLLQPLCVQADQDDESGNREEGGGGQSLLAFFFFSTFFGLCSSCTHFLHGNSCQNVVGLQRTTKLQLILEPGTGQEVRRSPASRVYSGYSVSSSKSK